MTPNRKAFQGIEPPLLAGSGPMHFSVAGIVLTAGCQFYGRCRRKYWTMAPIPNTMAGNRIATTIGGRAAAFGVISRGATIKKPAAKPVIGTQWLAVPRKPFLSASFWKH